MRKLTQERSAMNVISVGKPFFKALALVHTRKSTLERNHTYVLSVGRPSVTVQGLVHT